MSQRQFAVTWDYRCPFARNFWEHVLDGLAAGADWDVTYAPFSLDQAHVEEGEPDVWDRPEPAPGLLALEAGIAVRDHFPDQLTTAHRALFDARHDRGLDLRDPDVVGQVLADAGLDAAAVLAEVATGSARETIRKEHDRVVADHAVFGVPTVIVGDRAVFVRVMNRPGGDADVAVNTVERALDLVASWPELNEFKHTSIPR
ncbi:MAG TPA: DsbA family protein [Acidimicrobiales bacterium]|jgi:protein-disulfide isomerase-like protein with CxxC motif|nr:DsbA family protein [Acidimicrobiales bacterium]